MAGGRQRIVVTEIPYMVNKARLVEKMAELVHDKRLEGVSDIRDESDREGMRIVVELKRDVNAHVVLNTLYKHTQMQETFGVNMLALVDGEPKILSLRQCVHHYIDHQIDVITAAPGTTWTRPGPGRISWKGCSSPWTTSTR